MKRTDPQMDISDISQIDFEKRNNNSSVIVTHFSRIYLKHDELIAVVPKQINKKIIKKKL